ncbi:MAG: hypothetical protein RLT05_29425 [Bauldia litoralis]
MRSHRIAALAGVAAALVLGGCAGHHGLARVPTIDGLTVMRSPGAPNRVAVTAIGTVPSDGWSRIRLRPLHAPTHPPGVAAFELVGTAPVKRAPVIPGDRRYTATALAEVPPNTVLIYVLAGVNDDAKAMPGTVVVKRRWRRTRWRKRMVRKPK